MGIISRLKSIFEANANAALDKIEDPEKMIDQYLREAEKNLGEIKGKTAEAKVIYDKAVNKRDANLKKKEPLMICVEKCVKSGKEDDARRFLEKVMIIEQQQELLDKAAEEAKENYYKLYQLHDKLRNEYSNMILQHDTLKSRVAVVKAAQSAGKMMSVYGRKDISSEFERMSERIDDMVAKQAALDELDKDSLYDADKRLKDEEFAIEVDARLTTLKEELSA